MFQTIIFLTELETESSVRLNPDILETNIINLGILLAILFLVGKDFLSSTLSNRQNLIINEIKNSEEKLSQALKRLKEAEKQATQANILYQEINAKALDEKLFSLKNDYLETQQKIKRQCDTSFNLMNVKKLDILTEIKNDVTANAIYTVIKELETNFSTSDHERLIDERINLIKGISS